MKAPHFILLAIVACTGCDLYQPGESGSLPDAVAGFQTRLVRRESAHEPVSEPPPNLFRVVHYDSAAGKLAAYLTPDPGDGQAHPAILWITGGDCNTIGDVWTAMPADNDQTAAAYRKAGIVMMFPSLRGGNDNPGVREGFLGEVADVLDAAGFLADQPYVDPERIYLGGHSTGGTLALLVAERSEGFRAIFSFGPVDDVRGYGPEYLPFDRSNPREAAVRSPGRWLASIQTPTYVFEGTSESNIDCLNAMRRSSSNPDVHFIPIRGADHFSGLAPTNRLIAEKILGDAGPKCNLPLTEEMVSRAFRR